MAISGSGTAPPGEPRQLVRLAEALAREAEARTAEAHKDWVERWATPLSILLAAITILVGVWESWSSAQRADRTMRQAQYAEIVEGLSSRSVGVQVNSIRRLVQHVTTPENYDSEEQREDAARNAAQTLAAFIADESAVPGREGLSDYRDPQPVVVSRAFAQLTALMSDEDGFPAIAVDLSHGDFHGVDRRDVRPQGGFVAEAADFRGAVLTGWDLSGVTAPDLSNAFFTCADLTRSDLGAADVAATDFSGANLRGADLSEVRNLEPDQIRGALTGPATRLPAGLDPPTRVWGYREAGPDDFEQTPRCRAMLDRMTDLLAGTGFSGRVPCPGEGTTRWVVDLSREERRAVERVCELRDHFSPAAEDRAG